MSNDNNWLDSQLVEDMLEDYMKFLKKWGVDGDDFVEQVLGLEI
jgi:hypothetical protein